MAQRQIIVDDLDGETEGATVLRFGLDGTDYEIDLGPDNMASYRKELEYLIEHGRKVPTSPARRTPGARSTSTASRSGSTPKERELNTLIREWWRGKGNDISDRGRIGESIKAAYFAEHGHPTAAPAASTPPSGSEGSSESAGTGRPAGDAQTAAQAAKPTKAKNDTAAKGTASGGGEAPTS